MPADVKVDMEALERLMEPEEVEVCLTYILKFVRRRGSNIFQLFDTEEKKGPFRGKQEALVGAPRREGSLTRKLDNVCGITISIKEQWQKPPPCPERSLENAVAAAKFDFIQGRRRSVDLCGRQAQAACRVRGDGQENADISRRQ